MVSQHRKNDYLSVSSLWRGLTMGLACASGARGAAAASSTRDLFESKTTRQLQDTSADPLLPSTTLGGYTPPKVALAFLSKGEFPQEQTWRRFFEGAQNQVPLAPLQAANCARDFLSDALAAVPTGGVPDNPIAQQQLFSVYAHVPQDVWYAPESMFAPYVIETRLQTAWGTHSLTDAMRALLAEGLKDASNQVFLTVSDDAIPLHPPTVFYQSAMHFPASRINACLGGDRTLERWHEAMATQAATPVPQDAWRKSSQWFQLKRNHAEAVVGDVGIDATFRAHCVQDAAHHACASDEHYPATTLSMLGHTSQTDCIGTPMYTHWREGDSHPYTYQEEDISAEMLNGLAAQQGCYPLLAQQVAIYGFVQHGSPIDAAQEACMMVPHWSSFMLSSWCPLMARKFSKPTDTHVAHWMKRTILQAQTLGAQVSNATIREKVLEHAEFFNKQMSTEFFPDSGCASTRRDYIWLRGSHMDFTCPQGEVGEGILIEALRCYAERAWCEPVLVEKRRFFAVDSAFQDTLEGGDAMNNGTQILRALRYSEKPALHQHVAQGVIAALRDSELSVRYYPQELEVIDSDKQLSALSALWFDGSAPPPGVRDDRWADYAELLAQLVRNPAVIERMLEGIFDKSVAPMKLPEQPSHDFEAATDIAEAVVRAIAPLTQRDLSRAAGVRGPRRQGPQDTLGKVIGAAGRRLSEADGLDPNLTWLTHRIDGATMLAAIMVTLIENKESAEALARSTSLEMAAETLQPSHAHMHLTHDLNALISIAKVIAKRDPQAGQQVELNLRQGPFVEHQR